MSISAKFARWLRSFFGGHKPRVIQLPFSQSEEGVKAASGGESDSGIAHQPSSDDRTVDPIAATEPVASLGGRRAVLSAFDASRPISGRSQLFGRQKEIESLLVSTFDFCQHAIIFGARGSGKTSVARVFGDFADQCGAVVLYFPCEPEANFPQLMGALLDGLPPGAISSTARVDYQRRLENLPAHFGPLTFVDLVADVVTRPVVLILDEFDRITHEQTKTDIAVVMKLLSDTHAQIRIVLVGIASSVAEILTGHPSLRRHMSVTRIGRIEATSVNALIDHGAALAGLPFEDEARALIGRVGVGSPYHVRLLCRQAALQAISRQKAAVDGEAVRAGVDQIMDQWAGTNAADAARFSSLAMDPESHDVLEELANEAARNDSVAASDRFAPILAKLGDSVSRAVSEESYFVFADSLAPQFLIAAIVLAENETIVGGNVREGGVHVVAR